MAYVAADFYAPPYLYDMNIATSSVANAIVIDATGEKIAVIGQVKKTGNIRKFGVALATVVKAGGSGLTMSLQDVSTSGPPFQPDGVQDQTYAVANANAAFASNSFLLSGALSSDRAVTQGDYIASVVEFDGSGRLGSDSVGFSAMGAASHLNYGVVAYTTSWNVGTALNPILLLEYDDGSFSTIDGGFVLKTYESVDFNSGSTPDEYALEFSFPYAGKIDGGWAITRFNTTGDTDFVLYSGTTALRTASADGNAAETTWIGPTRFLFSSAYEFAADEVLKIALKPTTANNSRVYYFDVDAAGHFDALPGEVGKEWGYTTRVDGGSWAATTTTRRPMLGVHISAIDVGGGSSGGLLVHPGMRGGFA